MHQAACEHYLLVLQIILVTQTTQALPENIDILTLWRLRNFSLKYPCKCKLACRSIEDKQLHAGIRWIETMAFIWHTRKRLNHHNNCSNLHYIWTANTIVFIFLEIFHITLPWWGLEFSFKIMHQILRYFLNMSWTFYQCFKFIW